MRFRLVLGLACLCGVLWTAPAALAAMGPASPPPKGSAIKSAPPKPASSKPAPAKPAAKPLSAFDQEQAMTPAQLIRRWQPLVDKASKRFGVPVAWINAVMRMESGGRTMLSPTQKMISDRGALGIMQVLPGTYKEMAVQYRLGKDPFDPADNIRAGAAYLKWLKGKYGYPALFAAYNAGPGPVDDLLAKGAALPAETRAYTAGIGKILGSGSDGTAIQFAKFTRPDGSAVMVDPIAVRAVREVFPGEYADGVQSVIDMGVVKQGVQEDAATVTKAVRVRGGQI